MEKESTSAPSIEKHSRSRSRSSDHNERLEPQLLRAAEQDNVERLSQIIDLARGKSQLNENFLRIGLMRSAEKGKINATQYLLSLGAKPDGGGGGGGGGAAGGNRLSPLMRAVERNHIGIVHLLLEHDANPETADKKGRTALMTAAWLNYWHILNSLIVKGANVNAKDERRRNVLHNLAADKQCNWGDSVIELLLGSNIHIEGGDGQDILGRTPLHWACATGKLRLAKLLLERSRGQRADIQAVEIRGKTALHLAAAHQWVDIVEMLIEHGANVHAKSDGSWQPLHNACEVGAEKIVRILIDQKADINAKLLNGMTPLHLAAQGGHIEVVKCLLGCTEIKRAVRDTFGSTPFLRAAQNKRRDIVSLLAPFNHLETLSKDALGACNGFNATIVDFGNFHNENRVKRWSIFELLYGRDPINPRKPKLTVLPNEKSSKFRWIHLPANNMAWVEVLLTKLFIEEGASDIEGFKALERSFSNQHRGQQSHSHFMRPLCQCTQRAPRIHNAGLGISDGPEEQGPPTIIINGGHESHAPRLPTRTSTSRTDSSDWFKTPHPTEKENKKGAHKEKEKKVYVKGNKSPKGTETPTNNTHRKSSRSLDGGRQNSPSPAPGPTSPGRKEPNHPKENVFTFMPYLHFESSKRCKEMQQAIKRAEILRSPLCGHLGKAATYDEMLIRAHLATSTASLHVRRTLDQSFYHNIDTESRDQDQVVYRYQLRGKDEKDPEVDPKIVMVDQLWMWILGKDLIITAFPQRWKQPKNDPLNVLDSVIEDINSKTRDPVSSVYELAMIITSRCSGVFDRHRMGDEDYQFLDMFESSIGNATDRETVLFKEFNAASAQASQWLQQHRKPSHLSRLFEAEETDESTTTPTSKTSDYEAREETFKFDDFMRGPLFVDKLLDIGQETDLLAETKDIRDELNMISKVLEDQLQVLPDLQEAIGDIYRDEQRNQQDIKKRFKEQTKTIEMHIKDIERMDTQAKRIYKSITDMLDLKQKHANAFEARFARDQAAGTARQSQTIMVFTIVTIVFLPLSFIAAFFAINIREFSVEGGGQGLPIRYVAKYMFGIGLAVSIPMIVVALRLDDFADIWRGGRRWWVGWRGRRREERGKRGGRNVVFGEGDLEVLRLREERSVRKSVETWTREREGGGRSLDVRPVSVREEMEKVTGWKMRGSADVERGLVVRR